MVGLNNKGDVYGNNTSLRAMLAETDNTKDGTSPAHARALLPINSFPLQDGQDPL